MIKYLRLAVGLCIAPFIFMFLCLVGIYEVVTGDYQNGF